MNRPNDRVKTQVNDPESRDAFRVSARLGFEFRLLSANDVKSITAEEVFSDGDGELLTQLKRIDREAQKSLKIIADKNRMLGDYLHRMNQKLDLLARHSLYLKTANTKPLAVSLSETGVSFPHNTELEAGTLLAIQMVFLPDCLPVATYARVLRSIPENGNYQIAAEFYKLSDKDRQELARQVFKIQVNKRKHLGAGADKTDETPLEKPLDH